MIYALSSHHTLTDSSKIAVIGGGPAGSLFAIFALKMAKMIDKKIDITIFEPKDFSRSGPRGCNKCGGVISEHLVQKLALEGINFSPKIVQRGIDSYVLHTEKGSVAIQSPAAEKRIATVYRGGGPVGYKEKEWGGFDDFLLQSALAEGANLVQTRIDKITSGDKPVLQAKDTASYEADLVVGAFGVNSSTGKLFEGLGLGYKKPATTSAFVTELALGKEIVSNNFGTSIHFFLLPEPKNIQFAALIPKGDYVTLCILGSTIDRQTVQAFLDRPETKELLPEDVMSKKSCKCFPKLSLKCAKDAIADRVIIIGDAGSTRLFKDGIGAAYVMAKAAAKTAVFHGVGKKHFAEHYLPVYRKTSVDNLYGRCLYAITDVFKKNRTMSECLIRVVQKEQERAADSRVLSSILWDTFTGNESYKTIFFRGVNIKMHADIVGELSRTLRRGANEIRRTWQNI
jgi:flavin-dependent dehydrogenase